MNDKRRTGFFHLLDSLRHQKDAAQQLNLGISWAGGKWIPGPSRDEHVELLKIQKEMDDVLRRLAWAISKYRDEGNND